MAQAQVVAQVSVLSGQAFARDSAGNMRRLKLGDAIREGESVVAADGAKVVLTLGDGRELDVRPGETARIDSEVAAPVKPDPTDSAIANDQVLRRLPRLWCPGAIWMPCLTKTRQRQVLLDKAVTRGIPLLNCCVSLKPLIL